MPVGLREVDAPPPSRADLEREGLDALDERGPTPLIDGALLVSGQVERVTDFAGERREVAARPLDLGRSEPGRRVRDRGLVVVSACSHAGAINVMRHRRAEDRRLHRGLPPVGTVVRVEAPVS